MKRCVAFMAVFLLLAGSAVWAFFPSAKDIDQDLEDNYGRLASLQAEFVPAQNGTLVLRTWQQGASWRMEWVNTKKNRVICAAVGEGKTVRASFPAGCEPGPVPSWSFLRDIGWLKAQGMKAEEREYAFLGNRPCVVFGAFTPKGDGLRFWVDNEKKVPRRIDSGREMHMAWKKFHSTGNYPLPKEMDICWGKDKLHFRIEWTGVNVDIPGKLFSVSKFQSSFPNAGGRDFPETVRRSNRIFSRLLPE